LFGSSPYICTHWFLVRWLTADDLHRPVHAAALEVVDPLVDVDAGPVELVLWTWTTSGRP
jgi:hypothetical protein